MNRLGSSPLTRGKRGGYLPFELRYRLIPAHAGKTGAAAFATSGNRAHPRSRGENVLVYWESLVAWGSSPLTRGKRLSELVLRELLGLIPAHAGKTLC